MKKDKKLFLILGLIFFGVFFAHEIQAFDFLFSYWEPPKGEVFRGESLKVVFSLQLVSKKTKKVKFTIPKTPLGIQAKITPSYCYPPCYAILKISTNKKIAPGSYFIPVIASGKGVIRRVDYPLVVLPWPIFDYSLSLSHQFESIWPGQTTYLILNLKHLSGKSQKVSFKAISPSKKIKIKFSPSKCKPPCNATLRIKTSKKTPTGEYSIEILAVSKEKIKRKKFKLILLSDLSSPVLIFPKNKAKIITLRPFLDWTKIEGAKIYLVQINSYKLKTKNSFLEVPKGVLRYHKIYRWKVKACKDQKLKKCSLWSEEFKFKTIPLKELIEKKRKRALKKLQDQIKAIEKKIAQLKKQLERLYLED